jgi:hypothetical protein
MPVIDAAPSQMAKVIALRERRRPASPDTRTARRNRRKAAWIWLYALLPLSLPLFALADVVPATSPWRYCTESLAVLVLIGGAGLWVRLNRRALMDATLDRDEGHADLPPTT